MLKLRRPDTCAVCGVGLHAGTLAWWDASAKTVTCKACREGPVESGPQETVSFELDRGLAGASVAREFERRRSNRESRIRKAHPWIGGLLLTLRGAPQHELAFHSGELGEAAVAAYLEKHVQGPTILLHDRRMPGRRGNIDHLAIAPTGVFVIDAKNIKGKVRVANPLFGATKLLVAGRNRTKLIDGLDRQVSTVRDALTANDHADISVQGVLCFTTADLPLLGTLKMRGHLLLYRKALAKRLNADGPLQPTAIDTLAHTLAAALSPA